MYIESLRIRNTVTNKVMREVLFHKGANFVVDASASGRHNKVGKTTFLKLIDVLMGAKNKSNIYTDLETGNVAIDLRDTIVTKRIAAEMTLVKDFDRPCASSVDLKVELFPRGGYFVNGERMGITKYWLKLNELVFGIDGNIPTFRQLINSFVRVSVGGDVDSFLRTLPRANHAIYRSVYNYLFGISDPKLDSILSELKRRLNQARESLRQYKRVNDVESIEEQLQIQVALEGEYQRVKAQVDDIFDSDEYRANRDAIANVRLKYAELTDALSEVDYKISRTRDSLAAANDESLRQADLSLTRRFFDEVCGMLPSLNKTFEDMVSFNKKLCDNKIAYFQGLNEDLLSRKKELDARRRDLLKENGRFLSLVEQNRVDEYEELAENLMRIRQDIGHRAEVVDTLKRFELDIAAIQEEIDNYSTGGSAREGKNGDYQARMNSFNGFFTRMAERINGEKPILVYSTDTNKFPVSITEISGSSTGTRKSLIAAYDLAYQQFAAENGIRTPRFVVHDVVENVEGADLRAIIDASNSVDAQYIVAVLKEKLDSSRIMDKTQGGLRILQLSDDDRLFDGKTVEDAEQVTREG